MKKRIVSLCMAIALLLTLLPQFALTANAEDLSQSENKSTDNSSNWAEAYIPAVEEAIALTTDIIDDESFLNSFAHGILYDIDDDGVYEMVLSYLTNLPETWWTLTYSVYDFENGKLLAIAKNATFGASVGIADSSGYTGLAFHNGEPVLITYSRDGGPDSVPGEGAKYAEQQKLVLNIIDYPTLSPQKTIGVQTTAQEITYSVDGNIISETAFSDEMEAFTYLEFHVDSGRIAFKNTVEKMTLNELLQVLNTYATADNTDPSENASDGITDESGQPDNDEDDNEFNGNETSQESANTITFSDIPAEYTLTSGAGAWTTGLTLSADGSFEGSYHDSNMDETGAGYSRGTVYYCNFSGIFSNPEPVNEYTYKVILESFSVADQTGYEYIDNEIKYIASDPYGFDGPNEYYIYLPGIPNSMLPQNVFDWVSHLYGSKFSSYEVYIICSANGKLPFVGEFDYPPAVDVEEKENENETSSDTVFEDYIRTEWIEQHIEYAASDEYENEIVGGFNGHILDIFRNALDDPDIKFYDAAKKLSSILNADLELSNADMYELVIAQVLYGENSQYQIEEAFNQNLQRATSDFAKSLVNIANSGDSVKTLSADVRKNINDLYALLQTMEFGSEIYGNTFSEFMSQIQRNVKNLKKDLLGDVAFAGFGIVIEGAFEQYNALEDIATYICNYIAYQSTSKQTREVLVRLSAAALVAYDGSFGVSAFLEELDFEDAGRNLTDLQTALLSIIDAMLEYENKGASAVAEYAVKREREAMHRFEEKALKNIKIFVVEKALSCVPVLDTIIIAKNVANVALVATTTLAEIFTNIPERGYALDILTKTYCLSIMLDHTVDNCADNMSKDDFYSTTVFDESVSVYKRNLLLASNYALEYVNMQLANTFELYQRYTEEHEVVFNLHREKLVKIASSYSEYADGIRAQQNRIHAISCHDSDLKYDPQTDKIIYNIKDSRIYIVACPVDVIVTSDTGEQIAYLSGVNNQVASGYECYFHTIKTIDESGDYIKIAVVSDGYQIELKGTDDGVMNVFVANFATGIVGETKTYFNIPIQKDSVGYFDLISSKTSESGLVMDQMVYSNVERDENTPSNSKKNHILIVGCVILCGIVLFFLMAKNLPTAKASHNGLKYVIGCAVVIVTIIGLVRIGDYLKPEDGNAYQASTEISSISTPSTQEETIPPETTTPATEMQSSQNEPKIMIELGAFHSVYLREDGTVAATGANDKSKYKNHGLRCDVSGWTDVVAISASTHTLGLTKDGMVKATGVDRYGQCSVEDWSNIVSISAGDNHSLGVRSDGTVVAAGYNEYGQCDVHQWQDVIQVAAGTETSYGLRSNGTVLSAGSSRGRQTNTNAWSDIISISTGSYFVVGLKSDGTIITAGASEAWADEYSTWTDIVAVCAGSAHIVAVRSDGTVVACGDGSYGQCDVSSWTDIVSIGAGMYHTIGMKRDGTLVGAGHNAYGQLDLINYV